MRSDWTDEIAQRLLKPFPIDEIKWKPGAHGKMAYVDARDVMQRLDEAVGPGGWTFSWTPVSVTPTHVAVMGCLTVLDIQKCDAGEDHGSDKEEHVKAAVSDALKRCAVQFGIGRALYELPSSRDGKLSEADLAVAVKKTGYKPDAPLCVECKAEVPADIARISTAKWGGVVYCLDCGRARVKLEKSGVAIG